MFRFSHSEYLYALLLIPFLLLIFGMMWKWRKKAFEAFGEWPVISQLIPDSSDSKTKIKLALQLTGFFFLVIAIAGPQMGTKLEEIKREGSDIVIALDISNSMLAEDLSPNRLERAKQYISKLIDDMHGNRLGMVVFAGESFVQLPITTDYAAAKLFINTINTDLIQSQGTAIGNAISLAVKSFGLENESTLQKNKAIIIITDGENHEDDALGEATEAAKNGIFVHTIGMGSDQGAPIPIYKNGVRTGFRKDKEGNTVVTKMNESMLQELATAGKGIYVRAANSRNSLKILMDETVQFSDYDDKFQYFVALALFFLSLDFFISRRKSKWMSKIKLFEK
jgi:Ca-activated chloride channel homolog